MSNVLHQIQKQVVEIESSDPQEGFGFQQRIKEVYDQNLLPQMELLFDRYADEKHLIRLEKLELMLLLSDKNWEDDLVQQAIRKLDLILRESKVQSVSFNVNQNLPNVKSTDIDIIEIFCFFLETGTLPWFTKISLDELQSKIIQFLKQTNEEWQEQQARLLLKIKSILAANSVSIKRLIFQFSEDLLLSLFEKEKSFQFLKQWRLEKNKAFWITVIKASLISQKEIEREDVMKIFSNQLSQDESKIITESISLEKGKKTSFEEFYVNNAGLVLLQSFFIPFWQAVGLWENENFKNLQSQQRAVLLTQFLVFPETEIPEFDLMLNKILCGFPLEETLPAKIEINKKEQEEMNQLYLHINHHWKMHGTQVNTSAENLRSAFLQRSGKLSRKEKGWLLQVEQRPYDLVLNNYPWGFSIIKNKLMKEMLWVEWI